MDTVVEDQTQAGRENKVKEGQTRTKREETYHFGRKLKELRLGSGGVSQEQHVDVTPPAGAVGQGLAVE